MKYKKSYSLIFFLIGILISSPSLSQENSFWYNIISPEKECKYYVPSSNIGNDWISPTFNDDDWTTALSGIGYGDEDDNTIISDQNIYSVYIRHSFNILAPQEIKQLILDMDYDDGFIAYLNGTEIARANVIDPISWNMLLERDHEALLYQGMLPERWFVSPSQIQSLINSGENLLAIEIHNHQPTSSDLSSNSFLHGNFSEIQTGYSMVTEWFEPPKELQSHLPIVLINTNGLEIPDEPKITAEMQIIFHEGDTSSQYDSPNVYSGKIGIERRGESSSGFSKKQYAIETRTEEGLNLNTTLLGLPAENDWVLYAPYSDKSLIKNVLTYKLSEQMGNYAPRTRYVEVILNDDYKGIYVLMEKIKEDKNRVDIGTLLPQDIEGDELTGGYLLRNDKTTDLLADEYWTNPLSEPYGLKNLYQFYDPKYDELLPEQIAYIKDHMQTFERKLSINSFKDSLSGYRKYTDVMSFIDMMFINEISMNVDCYHFSTYFFKEKQSRGGKVSSGPVWDYNIAWGNVNYGNVEADDGFIYSRGGRMYWWRRMMEDPWYANQAYTRWDKLRADVLSWENIEHIIDSCITLMGPAIDRNYDKWQTLGTYVWPNVLWPDTYEEEIAMLKSFITDRLPWLDSQWAGKGDALDYPPHIECSEDLYIERETPNAFIAFDGELDPKFIWDDINVESVFNDINNSSSLNNITFFEDTKINWTVTDSKGQQNTCSFNLFVSVDNVFTPKYANLNVKFYPNPAKDYFNIESNFPMNNIEIYTMDGKIIHKQIAENQLTVKINSSNFDEGVYLITVIGYKGHRLSQLQIISH